MDKRKGMNRLLLMSASAIGIGFASAALAAGGGSVYLTQTGNSQTATVTQTGGTNDRVGSSTTPFLQQNGSGVGSNVLVINQNSETTSELPNIADFTNSGSGNVSTGYQSGSSNTAEIDQEGNNSSVTLQQSGKGNGPTGVAWFNATPGNLILQDWTANASTISLTQTNNVNATNGNAFSIGQGGTSNSVSASQTGFNKLWIRQGTTAPDLWAWTEVDPDPFAEYTLSGLSGSSITVKQSVGGNDPSGHNYAALGQGSGSGDSIAITQSGAANSVDVDQVAGNGNIFNSKQYSSDGNTGENFVGGEAGYPNADSLPIMQIGTGNEYDSYQSGFDLLAFGNQIGDSNFLNNTQTGDNNTLYSTQIGDSNKIYAVQSGSLNVATVSQTHNGSTASFTQSGSNNSATIAQ